MKSRIFKKLFYGRFSNNKQKILNIQEDAFKILEQMERKPEELLLEKIGIEKSFKLYKEEYSSGCLKFNENAGSLIIDNELYTNVTKNDIKDFVYFDIKRFYKFKKIFSILKKVFIGMGIGGIFIPSIIYQFIISSVCSIIFVILIVIENIYDKKYN